MKRPIFLRAMNLTSIGYLAAKKADRAKTDKAEQLELISNEKEKRGR